MHFCSHLTEVFNSRIVNEQLVTSGCIKRHAVSASIVFETGVVPREAVQEDRMVAPAGVRFCQTDVLFPSR